MDHWRVKPPGSARALACRFSALSRKKLSWVTISFEYSLGFREDAESSTRRRVRFPEARAEAN
jgi:hypothetical protein